MQDNVEKPIINNPVKERLNHHVKRRIQDSEDCLAANQSDILVPCTTLKKVKRKSTKKMKCIPDVCDQAVQIKTEDYLDRSQPTASYENFEPPVNNIKEETNVSVFHNTILAEILNAKKVALLQNPDVIKFFKDKINNN